MDKPLSLSEPPKSQIAKCKVFAKWGQTLAGAWARGTENGVNFVLLNKIVCFVSCVTSFPFVIFPLTESFLIHKHLTRDSHQFMLLKEYCTKSVGPR